MVFGPIYHVQKELFEKVQIETALPSHPRYICPRTRSCVRLLSGALVGGTLRYVGGTLGYVEGTLGYVGGTLVYVGDNLGFVGGTLGHVGG